MTDDSEMQEPSLSQAATSETPKTIEIQPAISEPVASAPKEEATNVNADVASGSAAKTTPMAPWSDVKVFLPPNTAGPSRIPPQASPSSSSARAGDEDEAKPTAAELKAAFSSHISQRHGPDAPLMTQAMREREEARLGIKKKEYHEIRIRIRLSDRTTLEGTFPATAKLPTLYRFLRAHLSPKVAKQLFTLYQSPPKRDLPETVTSTKMLKDRQAAELLGKNLRELGMAPAAVVLVRWALPEMNSDSFKAPLSDECLAQAQELPPPPAFDGSGVQRQDAKQLSSDKEDGSGSSGTVKKAMPKWLKGLQPKK